MAGVRDEYYSPAFRGICRGKRKETEDDGVPCILQADKSSKEYRKNMRISFIEDREVIKTILKHLGLC